MMNKANEFIKQDKSSLPNMQTLTNRDFINRIYVLRFEDCVESIKADMKRSEMPDFMEALTKLYWSFIAPRKHLLSPALQVKFDPKRINKEECLEFLSDIAEYMHTLGVNRPEKEQSDLDHIVITDMEVSPIET
jgi:hypothetical protein